MGRKLFEDISALVFHGAENNKQKKIDLYRQDDYNSPKRSMNTLARIPKAFNESDNVLWDKIKKYNF